jgi:hypothetical protein
LVCFFCIAVFVLVAGALTASTLDEVEDKLEEKATDGVRRVSDTESVARFELTVKIDGRTAPVAVTVYKEHARVRIQVLTHELTPDQVARLEDELAEAIDAKVVDRSRPDAHEHEDRQRDDEPEADKDRERVAAKPEGEAKAEPEREAPPAGPPAG